MYVQWNELDWRRKQVGSFIQIIRRRFIILLHISLIIVFVDSFFLSSLCHICSSPFFFSFFPFYSLFSLLLLSSLTLTPPFLLHHITSPPLSSPSSPALSLVHHLSCLLFPHALQVLLSWTHSKWWRPATGPPPRGYVLTRSISLWVMPRQGTRCVID